MVERCDSIPRPAVRANQWVIVLSVLITWITGFYWILLLPFLAGFAGLLFNFNPVMKFARLFLRKSPDHYIQEDVADQKFNQTIAVSLLGVAFLCFVFGFTVAGYIVSALVFIAATVAILGFCIGCFIRHRYLMYKSRKRAV